jgi:Protein of unknown function (DUF3572)
MVERNFVLPQLSANIKSLRNQKWAHMVRHESVELAEEIEMIGGACLDYLVAVPEELARFMGVAGYDPDSLRAAVGTRDFAVGLIDYVAANESTLVAVCANAGLSTGQFMRVWAQFNRAE